MHIRLATTTLNEAKSLPALAKGCAEMEIDSFIILDDNASDDGTEEVAYREFAKYGIPGKVLKYEWTEDSSLSDKRNYLLNHPDLWDGLTDDDYIFITQSDEIPTGTLNREHITEPIVMCVVEDLDPAAGENHVPLEWDMPLFIRKGTQCHWEGRVHELLLFDGQYQGCKLSSPRIHRYGSHCSVEMRELHAKVLEEEQAKEDTPRTAFYLAQTYQNLGRNDDAVAMYLHRATMINGFDEEQYIAMYRVGQLLEASNPIKACRAYLDAWSLRPNRKEPLFHLAHVMNNLGNHEAAIVYCNQALAMADTRDTMFVERWIERWGIEYQWSVAAWWCRIPEAYDVMRRLLERDDIPPMHRENIKTNLSQPTRDECDAAAAAGEAELPSAA